MFKKIFLINFIFIAACTTSLVKEEKYISTEPFKAEAYSICMASKKYKQEIQIDREQICRKDANRVIAKAESDFREYKADEHNYRLCRTKFSDINVSDKCFKKQQKKYYERELDNYRSKLK